MKIITTHKATDFDAFASVIAATLLYKDAIPVLPKSLNPNVKAFLSIHKDLFDVKFPKEVDLEKVKTLIVVDTNGWHRLDRMTALKARSNLELILWDHHKGGNIDAKWKCQEQTGATVTLLLREIRQKKILLTPMQSTLFLAGLYEDTGSLMFPSTTAEDAYAAAYLLERKADLKIVSSFLQPAYGEIQKDILFTMLKSATRVKIRGLSISISKVKIKKHVSSLSVVVHMYREILNVDAAFGIFAEEDRGKSIIIGRSGSEEINISKVLRDFGGGGHQGAGSAMIQSNRSDEIKNKILEMIRDNRSSLVTIGDLMSYPVFSVAPDTRLEEVSQILNEKGCTGFPVMDGEQMVGIISRRDLQKVKQVSQLKVPVKAFMSRNCITIDPSKSPADAARLMVIHDIGRLPVIQDGRLIGIITRSDAMVYFYDLLPE